MSYELVHLSPGALKPHPCNARTHSKKQVSQIAKSIEAFGFAAPVLVDEAHRIIAGHGRVLAAIELKLVTVPAIVVAGLSDAKRRALMLADNKIAENAGWDLSRLSVELEALSIELPKIDLDVAITGFSAGETDAIRTMKEKDRPDPADRAPVAPETPVTCRGDVWLLGDHRVMCGDARSDTDLVRLMGGEKAAVVFVDPPYNVRVQGHVGGRGATRHAEFAFASGEMTSSEFMVFLTDAIRGLIAHSRDGSLHYICMDWRHVSELSQAAGLLYTEQKNIAVWDKKTPGQGSLYRNQHEFVFVYKAGTALHINAIEQGRHGRNRSNIWAYSGINAFGKDRAKDLARHPTAKPVAMIVDVLRDASCKGHIVLDTFLGSGTTLMAAERADRRAFGLEYEPKYVDVAVRRWEEFTRRDAVLEETGETFEEARARRAAGAEHDARRASRAQILARLLGTAQT